MPVACAKCVCDQDILSTCVDLCHLAQTKLLPAVVPKWLSPLLLSLEMFEGIALMSKWVRYPKKVLL